LDILHVSASHDVDWDEFPGVRKTLERWKVIPEGSPRSEVSRLGIRAHKGLVIGRDPVQASLDYLQRHPTDLIVLAVRHENGRMRWLSKSVGEPIARKAGEMTLFLPQGVPGFVSLEDGSVHLNRILIPVTNKPDPQPSIDAVERLIRRLELPSGEIMLLHVGGEAEMPKFGLPSIDGWSWNATSHEGTPVDIILKKALEFQAGLIVMTTDGPDGFLDGLRGTTSERVLRHAQCPVVVMPLGSVLH